MFKNRLCDPKRQNRSALLYAATLVAIGAVGCADGAEDQGSEDQGDLAGTGGELEQGGPAVIGVERDTSPEGRSAVGSVTRQPVVPGGGSVDSEVGSVTRRPISPPLSSPYYAEVTANGTGCPAGTWKANISPDGGTFTITFNSYAARVDEKTAISIKDCQLGLKLKSPQQVSYAVQGFRFSGYSYLEPGVTASQSAEFYVQGNPRNSLEVTKELSGPYDGPYALEADIAQGRDGDRAPERLWSPCSAERDFNVQTRLRVRNGETRRNGFLNLAAVRGEAKIVIRLNYRKCSDSDELGNPVDPSVVDRTPGGGGPVVVDVDRDTSPTPSTPSGGPVVVDVNRDTSPTPSTPSGGPVVVDVNRDTSPTSATPSAGPVVVDSTRTEL